MFKIIKKDKNSNARLGILNTPHGNIKTPSYVIVATHAKIKCLKPSDIKKTKTQVVIANTYHLWDKALKNKKEKHLVHKLLGINIPIMTDSGGFQVFSLGFGSKNKVGKILNTEINSKNIKRQNIKITEKGVSFSIDGKKRFLGPELSIKIQENLGADIIFAFDECTSPLDTLNYNKTSMDRTHRWAQRCLDARKRKDQLLFGIVQGGKYQKLRAQSAKTIGAMPFDGIGIGGSFGKDEMVKTLKWVVPNLPEEKPRHLLGIGRIRDIFNAVENGIDLFDCVIPTREARHGRLWTKKGYFDIRKMIYKKDKKPIESGCRCEVCKSKTSRSKIYSLFHDSDKEKGQRLATIHNIWFFNNLLEQIRNSISTTKYKKLKSSILKYY